MTSGLYIAICICYLIQTFLFPTFHMTHFLYLAQVCAWVKTWCVCVELLITCWETLYFFLVLFFFTLVFFLSVCVLHHWLFFGQILHVDLATELVGKKDNSDWLFSLANKRMRKKMELTKANQWKHFSVANQYKQAHTLRLPNSHVWVLGYAFCVKRVKFTFALDYGLFMNKTYIYINIYSFSRKFYP